ncbi:ankyrin repeat domain-containing protein [Rickettsiella massiliensis]|uniref:ankyrin repeat domain-containing protein n=1 Tax=Rickettsiella massiliensis TaxID=676517 RepID=UPI00029A9D4E|nr:ankyrin repeat domain-containing protein [Rickettsiella massiliensis]
MPTNNTINSNQTVNNEIIFKGSNNLSRVKRSALEDRKKSCKRIKFISTALDAIAPGINSVLGFDKVGLVGGPAKMAVVGSAYLAKVTFNLLSVSKDCDNIPFEELQESLNRNYEAIQSGFKLIEKILNDLSGDKVRQMSSSLTIFINLLVEKQYLINNLNEDALIRALEQENGLLFELKRDMTSPALDSLDRMLNDIINQKLAVAKNPTDEQAFMLLGLSCTAIDTYTKLMHFLLQGRHYLMRYYRQKSNVEAYNRHYHLYSSTLVEFTGKLTGGAGLINKLIKVLESIRDSELIKKEREAVHKFAINEMNYLVRTRDELNAFGQLLRDTPTQQLSYDFSVSSIMSFDPWRSKQKISYAMQYKDQSKDIYYQISDWSPPYSLSNKANPRIDIGRGQQNMTRLIYRKFDQDNPELVAVVEDPNKTYFRDVDKDFYNAALEPHKDIARKMGEFYITQGANPTATFEKGRQAIHAAAKSASIENVLMVIKFAGRNIINVRDANGYTSICIAAKLSNNAFFQGLLMLGADINLKTNTGQTPLSIAAERGDDVLVKEILSLNTIEINSRDNHGFTALHVAYIAQRTSTLGILLEDKRVDVNVADENGFTVLDFAALKGDVVTMELLIKKGANLNSKTKQGDTATILATSVNHLEAVKFLAEQDSILLETKNDAGIAAIDESVLKNHWDVFKFIIDKFINSKKISSLTEYMPYANLEKTKLAVVKYLIDEKKIDFDPESAVSKSDLCWFVRSGYLNIVKYLIDMKSVAFDIKDERGVALFGLAIESGSLQQVKYFVEVKGINYKLPVDSNNPKFDSIKYAAKSGDIDIFKYFFEEKYQYKGLGIHELGDIRIKLKELAPLLNEAIRHNRLSIVKYLIEDKQMGPNILTYDTSRPLLDAAHFGHLELVKYLIEEQQVDFYSAKSSGHYALHIAAKFNHVPVVKYLIEERGVDVNFKTDTLSEMTALDVVILEESGRRPFTGTRYEKRNCYEVGRYLLDEAKADINVTNFIHFRDSEIEIIANQSAVARYLISIKNNPNSRSVRSHPDHIEDNTVNRTLWADLKDDYVSPMIAGAGILLAGLAGWAGLGYVYRNQLIRQRLRADAALTVLAPAAVAAPLLESIPVVAEAKLTKHDSKIALIETKKKEAQGTKVNESEPAYRSAAWRFNETIADNFLLTKWILSCLGWRSFVERINKLEHITPSSVSIDSVDSVALVEQRVADALKHYDAINKTGYEEEMLACQAKRAATVRSTNINHVSKKKAPSFFQPKPAYNLTANHSCLNISSIERQQLVR